VTSGHRPVPIALDPVRGNRWNIFQLPLEQVTAHDGTGVVRAVRIAAGASIAGGCEFIDYAEVSPGSCIGDHRHPVSEEEYYLVLAGLGTMRLESATVTVTAGDLVRNPPGGLHGLVNTGGETLQLFIFALRVEQ
jgi:mannose-6-phosphate isomerase-like protein (cupin superfamily)